MTIQRLSHIGICVSELERSVCFYRDALGFQELSRLQVKGQEAERLLNIAGGELQAVYLERDGTRIELLYYPVAGHEQTETPRPMNRLGFTHLSLRVADLESIVAAIEQNGGTTLAETRVDNDAWGSKAVFVTDPDGLRIELLQAPGDPGALPGSQA
jgi:catechol 2,3-dioxygenase-like lactoylglutathione lyase family enzyme